MWSQRGKKTVTIQNVDASVGRAKSQSWERIRQTVMRHGHPCLPLATVFFITSYLSSGILLSLGSLKLEIFLIPQFCTYFSPSFRRLCLASSPRELLILQVLFSMLLLQENLPDLPSGSAYSIVCYTLKAIEKSFMVVIQIVLN